MPDLLKDIVRCGHILLLGTLCVLMGPLSAGALESVSLQLHWTHEIEFAGFYAALEKGFYEEEGLDVALLEGGPQEQAPVRTVVSGKATYGVAGSELLLCRLKGEPVVALAPIFQHSAAVVLTREGTGIFSPQDFAGRRIEMGEKGNDAEIWAMIQAEGLGEGQFTRIPSTFTLESFMEDRVDAISAYVTSQPYVLLQKKVPYRVIRPIHYGIDFYGITLFTSEAEVENHPDRVRRFVRASLKGWRYVFEHPEEIIELVLERYSTGPYSHPREQLAFELEEMRRLILPKLVELGHMNEGRWEHIADTFVRIGLAEPGYDLRGFIHTNGPPAQFLWNHWGVKAGGMALLLAMGGAISLGFYNRRMRAEISRRIKGEAEREELITELTKALDEVRELNGLLPICSSCLKIRNDTGYWEKLESYIESHTKARFSHGICNECMKDRYPYLFDEEEEVEAEDFYNKESGTFPSD